MTFVWTNDLSGSGSISTSHDTVLASVTIPGGTATGNAASIIGNVAASFSGPVLDVPQEIGTPSATAGGTAGPPPDPTTYVTPLVTRVPSEATLVRLTLTDNVLQPDQPGGLSQTPCYSSLSPVFTVDTTRQWARDYFIGIVPVTVPLGIIPTTARLTVHRDSVGAGPHEASQWQIIWGGPIIIGNIEQPHVIQDLGTVSGSQTFDLRVPQVGDPSILIPFGGGTSTIHYPIDFAQVAVSSPNDSTDTIYYELEIFCTTPPSIGLRDPYNWTIYASDLDPALQDPNATVRVLEAGTLFTGTSYTTEPYLLTDDDQYLYCTARTAPSPNATIDSLTVIANLYQTPIPLPQVDLVAVLLNGSQWRLAPPFGSSISDARSDRLRAVNQSATFQLAPALDATSGTLAQDVELRIVARSFPQAGFTATALAVATVWDGTITTGADLAAGVGFAGWAADRGGFTDFPYSPAQFPFPVSSDGSFASPFADQAFSPQYMAASSGQSPVVMACTVVGVTNFGDALSPSFTGDANWSNLIVTTHGNLWAGIGVYIGSYSMVEPPFLITRRIAFGGDSWLAASDTCLVDHAARRTGRSYATVIG